MEVALITAIANGLGSLFDGIGSVFNFASSKNETQTARSYESSAFLNTLFGYSDAQTSEDIEKVRSQKYALLFLAFIVLGIIITMFLISKRAKK